MDLAGGHFNSPGAVPAVQNLCKDMSSAKTILSAVALMEDHGEVGRVDLEDCLLETMTGGCILHVRLNAC
jgi:hypothetical protein